MTPTSKYWEALNRDDEELEGDDIVQYTAAFPVLSKKKADESKKAKATVRIIVSTSTDSISICCLSVEPCEHANVAAELEPDTAVAEVAVAPAVAPLAHLDHKELDAVETGHYAPLAHLDHKGLDAAEMGHYAEHFDYEELETAEAEIDAITEKHAEEGSMFESTVGVAPASDSMNNDLINEMKPDFAAPILCEHTPADDYPFGSLMCRCHVGCLVQY